MKKLKRLLHDRSGSISLMFIALAFAMIVVVALLLEVGAAYERHDYIIDVAQRAANTAVESTIDDDYRQDRILRLRVNDNLIGDDRFSETRQAFLDCVSRDLSSRYSISNFTFSFSENPPGMIVDGEGSFSTIFSVLGFGDIHFSFRVRSTNYDTVDFEGDK